MNNSNNEGIASFFSDPDASDAIVLAANNIAAPVVQGIGFEIDELSMGGGTRIVYFIIDASPSMEPVAQALRDCFTNDFVPAVRDARESDISVLRIGGCVFSSGKPTPIWKGIENGRPVYFHTLDSLPGLTSVEYDPERGYGTSLHLAIIEGTATALRYAVDVQDETGTDPEVDIIILSDGANNDAPRDPSEARKVIQGCDPTRVRHMFFYFDTSWGLPDAKTYATRDLGISSEQVEEFLRRQGETDEDMAKRFRRMMAVMSRVSASRGTSVVVATAAVPDDDELV